MNGGEDLAGFQSLGWVTLNRRIADQVGGYIQILVGLTHPAHIISLGDCIDCSPHYSMGSTTPLDPVILFFFLSLMTPVGDALDCFEIRTFKNHWTIK